MYNIEHFFISNLKYLFELNRRKNNQKKSNFISETSISRSTIKSWMDGHVPIRSNMNTIVQYFNRWLGLHLTREILLSNDLSMPPPGKVAESSGMYGSEDDELCKLIITLNPQDKLFIKRIVKGLLNE